MEQDRQNPSPFWDRPESASGPSENKPKQSRQASGPFWSRPGQPEDDTPAGQPYSRKKEPANSLAVASMVLGILALITIFTVYLPIILGSLSIILALLSRGGSLKMHNNAHSGVVTSSIALGCDAAIFIMAFALIFGMPDFFEKMYGMSYQEMMEQMEDGTLDYEELYNNIYENTYNNMYEDTYEDLYEYLPEDMQEELKDYLEQMP